MATDGPDPKNCGKTLFNKGEHVWTFANLPTNAIESLVRAAALISGQEVDWHFYGGRAVVLTLGDPKKVQKAIEALQPLEWYLLTRKDLEFDRHSPWADDRSSRFSAPV